MEGLDIKDVGTVERLRLARIGWSELSKEEMDSYILRGKEKAIKKGQKMDFEEIAGLYNEIDDDEESIDDKMEESDNDD